MVEPAKEPVEANDSKIICSRLVRDEKL